MWNTPSRPLKQFFLMTIVNVLITFPHIGAQIEWKENCAIWFSSLQISVDEISRRFNFQERQKWESVKMMEAQ